jgi:GAF domain-containing protein
MLLIEHGAEEGEGPSAKQLMMDALRYVQPAPLPRVRVPSAVLKDPYLELHRLSEILSHKTDGSGVFRMVVESGRSILGADGCTLYLVRDGELHVEILLSQTLNLTLDASEKGGPLVEATPIWRPDGEVDETSLAAVCAATCEPINVADVRELPDWSRTHAFDEKLGYSTVSVLNVPVLSRGRIYGVLQFVNALDNSGRIGPFTKHHEAMANSVATLLSLAPLLFGL